MAKKLAKTYRVGTLALFSTIKTYQFYIYMLVVIHDRYFGF